MSAEKEEDREQDQGKCGGVFGQFRGIAGENTQDQGGKNPRHGSPDAAPERLVPFSGPQPREEQARQYCGKKGKEEPFPNCPRNSDQVEIRLKTCEKAWLQKSKKSQVQRE